MGKKLLSAGLLVASALALYNVYGDDADVRAEAERVACGARPCVRLLRTERRPLSQTFVFQTALTPPETREVRCARAYWLAGPAACTAH